MRLAEETGQLIGYGVLFLSNVRPIYLLTVSSESLVV